MKYYRKTSHAIYDLKYHICWITKYRYKVLRGDIAKRTRDLLRQTCSKLDTQIITGNVGTAHIHMLVSVPPNVSVSKLVQNLKGSSSRKLQQEFPALKKQYWGQHLWARGYFAVSSGNVTDETWMEYIRNQDKQEKDNSIGDFQITSGL